MFYLLFIPMASLKTTFSTNMGVSLNGGTPISHPKMIIFSRKTPWLLGTTILGNPHIYIYFISQFFYVFFGIGVHFLQCSFTDFRQNGRNPSWTAPCRCCSHCPLFKTSSPGVLEKFSVCLFGLFVCLFEFVCLCCFFFGEECSFFSGGGWVENPKRCSYERILGMIYWVVCGSSWCLLPFDMICVFFSRVSFFNFV